MFGEWKVTSQLRDFRTPLGPECVDARLVQAARQELQQVRHCAALALSYVWVRGRPPVVHATQQESYGRCISMLRWPIVQVVWQQLQQVRHIAAPA